MNPGIAVGASICILLGFSVVTGADDAAAKGEKGRSVYTAQRCSFCHSIEGKGNKSTPLDGVGSRLTAEKIKKWIVSPREMKTDTKMRAFPRIPPDELEALVTYLTGLKKQEGQP